MTKVTEAKLTIKGKSNKEYQLDIYSLDTNFKAIGGIYIFTRRYQGKDDKYYHDFIYCGKTEDLSIRFDNHHKEDCIKENNANCISIIAISNEEERTGIEDDILLGNNFSCNEVLN